MSRLTQIGRSFPRNIVHTVTKYIDMAGIKEEAEWVLGGAVVFAVGFGLLVFIIALFGTSWISAFSAPLSGLGDFASQFIGGLLMFVSIELASVVAVAIVIYAYLLVQMDARRREIESVLPDFLQLSAANVRAGLPVEQALWRAATPEFGVLSKEVQIAMKRTFSGESLSDSLTYLANRFNSKYLMRTVSVLKFGIASGGEIGEIMERTAADLRKMQILYKEASSSMIMYVIFISFAALIGAPFLFAISYKLIATLSAVWAHLPPTQDYSSFGLVSFSPPQITPDDFKLFAILSIMVTSVFASFILAVIQSGSPRDGLKLLPFFLIAGIGLLLIFMGVINSLLSSLFI
ncbi:MAG: type II secretion system F family protein [Candidatus Micrarchaeia archaeon]